MINIYHTENLIFNTSKFMEDLLKNQQKIRFIGAGVSHKNGSAERTINMVVTLTSAILMQSGIIRHKDTLSIRFGRRKWTMLYGYKFGSLIYSMVCKPLGKFEPYVFLLDGSDPRGSGVGTGHKKKYPAGIFVSAGGEVSFD